MLMSKTIVVQYSHINIEDYEITENYLTSLGMTFNGGFEDTFFFIETHKEPEVLKNLGKAGIFELRGGWRIIRITPQGITLYIACPLGDAYTFIPSHQIIAIHTVDKSFISEIQQEVKKRKL